MEKRLITKISASQDLGHLKRKLKALSDLIGKEAFPRDFVIT